MFEQFSRGYYLGRLYVEPHEGGRAVMHDGQHERVNEQLYADGEGVERLDHPLLMKVGRAHVPVHGEEGVPERTLALPAETLDAAGVRNPPTLSEVLLAKREVAEQLFSMRLGSDEPAGI
jgi:hypothetical protein